MARQQQVTEDQDGLLKWCEAQLKWLGPLVLRQECVPRSQQAKIGGIADRLRQWTAAALSSPHVKRLHEAAPKGPWSPTPCTWCRVCEAMRAPLDISPCHLVWENLKQVRDWILGSPIWKGPDSPQRWAKKFNTTAETFVSWAEEKRIRTKKLSPKRYLVALADIPKPD